MRPHNLAQADKLRRQDGGRVLHEGDIIDIWVVEKALGAGGMGSVYRCHNRTATRILAAVKVLEAGLRNIPGAQERFIREAEILFQIDHPNIVKVRNVRTDADPPYLEMEFVEGQSLEHRLHSGPIPLDQAIALVHQLVDAVRYLHEKGIRHRDIKPANLLLKSDGSLKLVDFGLAMEADVSRITSSGMTFGTVSYAPPEWVNPDLLDPVRWDLYAIGVVFWEMLTGDIAYPVSGQGSARQQAMQVILSKQTAPPLDPGDSFPDDIRRLIRDLTRSRPDERPATAHIVQDRLVTPGYHGPNPTVPMPAIERKDRRTWVEDSEPTPAPAPNAARPVNDQPTRPPERTARRAPVIAIALLLGVVVVSLIGTGLMLMFAWIYTNPAARDVEIVVSNVPRDNEVGVWLDGTLPATIEGAKFRFQSVPTQDVTLHWAIGPSCASACAPGMAACPGWCGTGNQKTPVMAGRGPLAIQIAIPPVPTHTVTFTVPNAPGATLRIGSETIPSTDATHFAKSMTPGRYTVAATIGACPNPCAGTACPQGCTGVEKLFEVPWGSGSSEVIIPLEPPPPAPPGATNPGRRPRGGSSSGHLVTAGEFESWLQNHPEWQRDEAIARGVADRNYLRTGKPAETPGSPMVGLSGLAAKAYCATRGGLAPFDAPPETWAENTDHTVGMEWRQLNGVLVLRGGDGMQLDKVNDGITATAVTGARCAR